MKWRETSKMKNLPVLILNFYKSECDYLEGKILHIFKSDSNSDAIVFAKKVTCQPVSTFDWKWKKKSWMLSFFKWIATHWIHSPQATKLIACRRRIRSFVIALVSFSQEYSSVYRKSWTVALITNVLTNFIQKLLVASSF